MVDDDILPPRQGHGKRSSITYVKLQLGSGVEIKQTEKITWKRAWEDCTADLQGKDKSTHTRRQSHGFRQEAWRELTGSPAATPDPVQVQWATEWSSSPPEDYYSPERDWPRGGWGGTKGSPALRNRGRANQAGCVGRMRKQLLHGSESSVWKNVQTSGGRRQTRKLERLNTDVS